VLALILHVEALTPLGAPRLELPHELLVLEQDLLHLREHVVLARGLRHTTLAVDRLLMEGHEGHR